jgi:hypothetical protein
MHDHLYISSSSEPQMVISTVMKPNPVETEDFHKSCASARTTTEWGIRRMTYALSLGKNQPVLGLR